ncbi:nucleotidyltransferase family protein [Polaribacter sp.]
MTYKESLFFVGKCLTISHETQNRLEIEAVLKAGSVDWDAVVKVSTAHYVMPALYLNLERASFLRYLPDDLIEFMKHITDLNRERNEQIIAQAKELNTLLLANEMTPIFLKGTGNLLEGLYEDVAERMVGDIDFIFSKEDYPKAIDLLTHFGYEPVLKYDYYFPSFKHYPRIQKEGLIAAVEIHKELLVKKYASEFNYDVIKGSTQQFGALTVMSYPHQVCLSIIAKQINDDGRFYKDISLRNAYDVFLLSQKTAIAEAFDGLD